MKAQVRRIQQSTDRSITWNIVSPKQITVVSPKQITVVPHPKRFHLQLPFLPIPLSSDIDTPLTPSTSARRLAMRSMSILLFPICDADSYYLRVSIPMGEHVANPAPDGLPISGEGW